MTRQRQYQLRMRRSGRCIQCGKSTDISTRKGVEYKSHCDVCEKKKLANQKRIREKKKAKGLCVSCGNPKGETLQCEVCRAKNKLANMLWKINR